MFVYIGPCNYGTYDEIGEPSPGNPSEIDGDLDMRDYQFVNLQQLRESNLDAATVGIVSYWVGALNSAKVEWSGGTMTGNLNMGGHILREVGDPEDDQDAINKQILYKNSFTE